MSQRITIAGTTGSGKTTLARRIAGRLGIEHVEMDALHHGPNWTVREQFVEDVEAFTARDAWVTEWGYQQVRPLVLQRATLVVWLDYPFALRFSRNVRRTVGRSLRHEELWNGNVEPPLWKLFTDPDHIIRWAWKTRHKLDDLPDQLAAAGCADLPVVRLRSQRETDAWLASL